MPAIRRRNRIHLGIVRSKGEKQKIESESTSDDSSSFVLLGFDRKAGHKELADFLHEKMRGRLSGDKNSSLSLSQWIQQLKEWL